MKIIENHLVKILILLPLLYMVALLVIGARINIISGVGDDYFNTTVLWIVYV